MEKSKEYVQTDLNVCNFKIVLLVPVNEFDLETPFKIIYKSK